MEELYSDDNPPPTPMSEKMRCPRCKSSSPHLHQFEGEVSPCSNDFHFQLTSQNTQAINHGLRIWFTKQGIEDAKQK